MFLAYIYNLYIYTRMYFNSISLYIDIFFVSFGLGVQGLRFQHQKIKGGVTCRMFWLEDCQCQWILTRDWAANVCFVGEVSEKKLYIYTLPETNIAPEKVPCQKESSSNHHFSGAMFNFYIASKMGLLLKQHVDYQSGAQHG